jgi:hypothetical protein
MDESGVRMLLDDLAEAPQPPSAVDVARAMAVGDRTVRRRRVGVVAAVAVIVCGFAAGAVGLVSRQQAEIATPPAPVPVSFPLTSSFAKIGVLPGGMNQRTTTNRVDSQVVYLSGSDGQALEFSVGNLAEAGQLSDAEPLNGHQARWNAGHDGLAGVRWEYAPGRWAQVLVRGLPADQARQIAADVRFDVNEPLTLPAEIADDPSLPITQLKYVQYLEDPSSWVISSRLGDVQAVLEIYSGPRSTGDWPLDVDGKPARDEGGVLKVQEGPQLRVEVQGPGIDRVALYRRVHLR